MKRISTLLLTFAILVMGFIISCKKKDNPPPSTTTTAGTTTAGTTTAGTTTAGTTTGTTATGQTCYLTNIKAGSSGVKSLYIKWTANKIDSVRHFDVSSDTTYSTLFSYDKYEYSGNLLGLIRVFTSFDKEMNQYQYKYNAANDIAEVHHFKKDANGNYLEYDYVKYSYKNGKLWRADNFYKPAQVFINEYSTFFTYDPAGNLVKDTTFRKNVISGATSVYATSQYTYDSKKNPLTNSYMDGYFLTGLEGSVNNLIEVIVKDGSGSIDDGNSYSYEYEYNSNGYPTKSTWKPRDMSGASVKTYEYNCK